MKPRLLHFGAAATLAALLAGPALAQSNSSSTVPPTSKDEVRVSKLVGSTVYNQQNQSVGSLDDILLTHDQKQPTQAVISVGGFLGIGSKLVEVPYDKLTLQENNKVVMPDASRDQLKNMPTFSYSTLEHGGTTNASSNTGNATGTNAAANQNGMASPNGPNGATVANGTAPGAATGNATGTNTGAAATPGSSSPNDASSTSSNPNTPANNKNR